MQSKYHNTAGERWQLLASGDHNSHVPAQCHFENQRVSNSDGLPSARFRILRGSDAHPGPGRPILQGGLLDWYLVWLQRNVQQLPPEKEDEFEYLVKRL